MIVVILIGLGGRFRSRHIGGKPQRDGKMFMGKVDHKKPCNNFNLAIGGGLSCTKWLKTGAWKKFIFLAIIPALHLFW